MTDGSTDSLLTAFNDADRLEIRKHLRQEISAREARNFERWIEGAKRFSEQSHDHRVAAQSTSTDFAKIFIRSLFILNGGAIIALLTFIGSMITKADHGTTLIGIQFARSIFFSFSLYISGLVFISLAAAIGYFNWAFIWQSYYGEGHTFNLLAHGKPFGDADPAAAQAELDNADPKISASMYVGVGFAIMSLIAFIWGSVGVASAFAVLG